MYVYLYENAYYVFFFFFSSRRRHTRLQGDWSSDVCSSDLFHAPDTHHVLQTQEWQGTFRVEFNNGSYSDDDIVDVFTQRLTTPFNIYKNVFIPVGEYHWTRHQLTYGTSQAHRFIITFFERFG